MGTAIIADYDLINHSKLLNNPEYNPEQVKTLKLIQGALRLSAHIYFSIRDRLRTAICAIIKRQQLSPHSFIFLLGGFGFDELESHAIALPNSEQAFPVLLTLAQGWR